MGLVVFVNFLWLGADFPVLRFGVLVLIFCCLGWFGGLRVLIWVLVLRVDFGVLVCCGV